MESTATTFSAPGAPPDLEGSASLRSRETGRESHPPIFVGDDAIRSPGTPEQTVATDQGSGQVFPTPAPASSVPPPISPRSFGLIAGALCGLMGGWPVWSAAAPPATWALAVGSLLIALALLQPALLAGPARSWHRLGLILGWINTRILLVIAFAVLFVPLGLLRRLFGADPLHRAWEGGADTYRTPSRPRDPGHFRQQS